MSGTDDTIVALASGAGAAGVAVIRLSGPQAGAVLDALAGGRPQPRRASTRVLRQPGDDVPIDRAMVLWFPAPASFTGEDVAELHVHGGPAVIAAVVEAALRAPGVRSARPGEFTRRAFAHGKLDLTQAEAIADLVAAETQAQRRQAARQAEGALSKRYTSWREQLLEAAALLEADIDFPDEGLPDDLVARRDMVIDDIRRDMAAHLDDARRGERVRDGLHVAIIGPPNVGKSTLLNALARREAAIVSPIAGTTRDVVEVRVILGGLPILVSDTAGLRAAGDMVEAEGVRRAMSRAENADLRLIVVSEDEGGVADDVAALAREGDLIIWNKWERIDPPPAGPVLALAARLHDGEGVEEIENHIACVASATVGATGPAPISRARHRHAVQLAATALDRSRHAPAPELAAEDLRLAIRALDELIGRIDVEDVLDGVFGRFCIGK